MVAMTPAMIKITHRRLCTAQRALQKIIDLFDINADYTQFDGDLERYLSTASGNAREALWEIEDRIELLAMLQGDNS